MPGNRLVFMVASANQDRTLTTYFPVTRKKENRKLKTQKHKNTKTQKHKNIKKYKRKADTDEKSLTSVKTGLRHLFLGLSMLLLASCLFGAPRSPAPPGAPIR